MKIEDHEKTDAFTQLNLYNCADPRTVCIVDKYENVLIVHK